MATNPIPTPPPVPGQTPTPYGHWNYPDYTGLLNQWMEPYQTNYNSNMAAQLAQLQAAEQVAQNRFSGDPYSEMTQLADQHNRIVHQITNTLAARGILHSGELPYQQGQETKRYGAAEYAASNRLLDYLNSLQQQYANQQRSGLDALQQQQMSLAQQLSQLYTPTWVPQTLASNPALANVWNMGTTPPPPVPGGGQQLPPGAVI